MSKASGHPSTDTLSRVVNLLVKHEIKLDALERLMKETNPLVHERYLGAIETSRSQRAAEIHQAIIRMLEPRPTES